MLNTFVGIALATFAWLSVLATHYGYSPEEFVLAFPYLFRHVWNIIF